MATSCLTNFPDQTLEKPLQRDKINVQQDNTAGRGKFISHDHFMTKNTATYPALFL